MKLVVVLEHHFVRCPEGVFTSLAFGYTFWEEYLKVFDEVCVVARMAKALNPPPHTFIASGKHVSFYDITDYRGMWDFVKKILPISWKVFSIPKLGDAFILFSGNIGVMVWFSLMMRRKKYFFRCVGNVQLGIATENRNFLYKYVARLYHFFTTMQAKNAVASSYTSEYLRKVYPNRYNCEYVFSNVELVDRVFCYPRVKESFQQQPFRFISVGRVEKQKGHAWLLQAIKKLKEYNTTMSWHLRIVGPGSQIKILQNYVCEYQLQEHVEFCGSVKWGEALFRLLDEAHIFVLPSLTEGMPRALLEGMARGLPAIASNTGGNPEIVQDDCLVAVGDVTELANKMQLLMGNTQKLAQLSQQNWNTAKRYQKNFSKAEFLRCVHENSSSY